MAYAVKCIKSARLSSNEVGYTKSGQRPDLVKHVPARRSSIYQNCAVSGRSRKNGAKRNVPRRVRDPRSAFGATQRVSVVRRSGCSPFFCLHQSNSRSDLRAERMSGLAFCLRACRKSCIQEMCLGKPETKPCAKALTGYLAPYINAGPCEGNEV